VRDPNVAGYAMVQREDDRTLAIIDSNGVRRSAVGHVDDPQVRHRPSYRRNGAWDFTERDKMIDVLLQNFPTFDAVANRLAELEAEVVSLASRIDPTTVAEAKPTRKANKPRPSDQGQRLAAYRALVAEAKELGIEWKGKAKQAWLQEQIAAHKAQPA
jgi:hypothetical protein